MHEFDIRNQMRLQLELIALNNHHARLTLQGRHVWEVE